MGKILPWPIHGRASSKRKPKIDRLAARPRSPRAAENVKKWREGMVPDAFQLLTAGAPTPASSAAAVVPPTASITASAVSSIPFRTSQKQKSSRVPINGVETSLLPGEVSLMAQSAKEIGKRLERSRLALGLRQKDMANLGGCTEGAWSDFESGKRRISLNVALRLRETAGLSMDWTYWGVLDLVPHALAVKIEKIAA